MSIRFSRNLNISFILGTLIELKLSVTLTLSLEYSLFTEVMIQGEARLKVMQERLRSLDQSLPRY